MLEYDRTVRVLTVHDGFVTWHGDIHFITKITQSVDLEDGSVVHIDIREQS